VFALAKFATISIETVHVWSKSLRQKQLAFVKRSKRDATPWVGAFMQHELDPVFSGKGDYFGQEMANQEHVGGRLNAQSI
jgi:hypothetical protein